MTDKTKQQDNFLAKNCKKLITDDNKLTLLGAFALSYLISTSVEWFFKNLNSN